MKMKPGGSVRWTSWSTTSELESRRQWIQVQVSEFKVFNTHLPFLVAVVANDHKHNGLKWQKCSVFRFWRSNLKWACRAVFLLAPGQTRCPCSFLWAPGPSLCLQNWQCHIFTSPSSVPSYPLPPSYRLWWLCFGPTQIIQDNLPILQFLMMFAKPDCHVRWHSEAPGIRTWMSLGAHSLPYHTFLHRLHNFIWACWANPTLLGVSLVAMGVAQQTTCSVYTEENWWESNIWFKRCILKCMLL